jgi:hypothetical protein
MAYLLLLWLLRIHIGRTKAWSFQGSLFIREPHHCSLNKFLAGIPVSKKQPSNKCITIFQYRDANINTSDDDYSYSVTLSKYLAFHINVFSFSLTPHSFPVIKQKLSHVS